MTNPLNWLSQIGAVTRFALQTIPQRKGASLAAAFGIAGVVAVFVGVLSIAQGFRRAVTTTGSPDTVIVFRSGSDTEMTSILLGDEVKVITDAPGIARGTNGALASAEVFVIIDLPKRSTGTDANVPLRGVQPAGLDVRGNIRITAGRPFERGRNEILVGRGAAAEVAGLEVGKTVRISRQEWLVAGVFSADGGIAESEIWTDASALQSAYQRENAYQAVYARLVSVDAFQPFKDSLTTDPRLNVRVVRETEHYAEQSRMVYSLITVLGSLVAGLMAVGAVFGALNTMYTAVAARTREIATLRALGFHASPVVISVLLESVLLALAGGSCGAALAYFGFDGFRTSTMNWQTFSQVAFAFDVTPALLLAGLVISVALGFLGGLFPAIRAARLPIAAALREA